MTQRSKKHHQVPVWLLRSFCNEGGDHLWVGFYESGKVMKQHVEAMFYRKNANTSTSYISDGRGGFRVAKSDHDEGLLAEFDDRTAEAAKQLLRWTRQHLKTGQAHPLPPPDVVNLLKELIVAQARRTHENQDRVGFTEGYEDLWWDLAYESAEADGFELGPREKLIRNPDIQTLVSNAEQNTRARFASGDHPILKDKENTYLSTTGLGVGVIVGSNKGLVIGSQGITILRDSGSEVAYLPLAPDVVACLTPRPNSLTSWTCDDNFVEQHNKAAYTMNRSIAGNSKQTIEDLLGTHSH